MKAYFTILLLFLALFETRCGKLEAKEFRKTFTHTNARTRIKVHLVFDENLAKHSALLAELSGEALRGVERVLGLEFRDSFWIYFTTKPEEHNGLATVLPGNRVYVNTSAPDIESSLAYSSDYLADTLWHELTHMIVIQQREAVFRLLSGVVGNLSRPVAAWPRWLHEGLAVWVESQRGGRGKSGIIELGLRQWAQARRAQGKSPFETYHLDGEARLLSVHEGELPYHFGYLLVDRIFGQDGKKAGNFVRKQAAALGSAFRVELRGEGVILDESLRALESEWIARYAQERDEPPAPEAQGRAARIRGPFKVTDGIAWIEGGKNSTILLKWRKKSGELRELAWPYARLWPEALFPQDGVWRVYARKNDASRLATYEHLYLELSAAGNLACKRALPARLKDFRMEGEQMAWIRETALTMRVERSERLAPCHWAEPRLLFEGRDFERVSNLRMARGQWIFTSSQGRNTHQLETRDAGRVFAASTGALSAVEVLPAPACGGASDCYLAQWASRTYWGPVLISCRASHCESKSLKLQTGSDAWTFADGVVWLKSLHWSEDEVSSRSLAAFTEPGPQLLKRVEQIPLRSAAVETELKPYRASQTIFPDFWMPLVAHDNTGTLMAASTFYEDITQRWAGETSLGYATELKSFLGSTQLERRFAGTFLERIMGYLQYQPLQVGNVLQKRWDTGLVASAQIWEGWRHRLYAHAGADFMESSATRYLRPYSYLAPRAKIAWYWGLVQDAEDPAQRASQFSDAFSLWTQGRWLESWETKSAATWHLKLPFSVLQTQVEHAYTDRGNYPASFFEWGGRQLFSTVAGGYLNRGFAPRFVAAHELLRFSLEASYRLRERLWSASWNRLRFEEWDQRLVAETLTWDSFHRGSRYKLGRQYFSSVGLENDFFAQILHYVNLKNTLGIYKGFGTGGEWRFTYSLQSYLDLL
jgi:hypothetical protein